MSCGQPSQEDVDADNIPILPPPSSTCVRCGNPPKIVVRATAWCHDCFLASFQGRFRKLLEGAKLVSRDGFESYKGLDRDHNGKDISKSKSKSKKKELSKVVLAFSGGSSSRAMMELFKTSYYKQAESEVGAEPSTVTNASAVEQAVAPIDGTVEAGNLEGQDPPKKQKKKQKKPQQFPPAFSDCYVLYIDESELPGFGPDKTEEIRNIVETTTPFKFISLKLSSIFSSSSNGPVLTTSTASAALSSRPCGPATIGTSTESSSPESDSPSSSSSSSSSPESRLLSLLHPNPPLAPTTYATLHQTLLQTLILRTATRIATSTSTSNLQLEGTDQGEGSHGHSDVVLLLGENSTRIGIKTISNMSQGRGWSLGEEISLEYVHHYDHDRDGDELGREREEREGAASSGSDDREGKRSSRARRTGELLVCRPMGNSLSKEVGYFVQSQRLETVTITNEDTSVFSANHPESSRGAGGVVVAGAPPKIVEKDIKKIGIGRLVEDFVLNLEAQFPSTVSIITKTAHKLGMRSADHVTTSTSALASPSMSTTSSTEPVSLSSETSTLNQCALCEMPAQSNASGWNQAITISDLISARRLLDQPSSSSSKLDRTTTSLETEGGGGGGGDKRIRKREPYQPSSKHLIHDHEQHQDEAKGVQARAESATTTTAIETDRERQGDGTGLGREKEGRETSFDLSHHLCYGCLLLLQTSRTATSRGKISPGDSDLTLPGYVFENVERRRRSERNEEVGGGGEEEQLRRQIEDYLLE